MATDGWRFREGDEIAPGRRAVRLLGGGRRYEAYLGWDDDLHALVAIKVLRPSLVDNPGTLAGLAGETRALGLLAHPAIVRAFDAVLEGPRPHLVLEFLDGPRLSTLVRRYGLAIEQVLALGLQLAAALHYMGTRGVLHLDLKPRNIIMAGPPRLIDLSVARPRADVPRIDGPVGTPAYMAPEQCDPARFGEISPASDVWGLGASLHEAMAGAPAFPRGPAGAADLGERYPQLVRDPSPLPARARPPRPLADLVARCLAREPADRPGAAEVAAELEPMVAALPRPKLGLFRPGGGGRAGV